MNIPSQLSNFYKDILPRAVALSVHIKEFLGQECQENKWLYISRVKQLESFTQKLEMGRYSSIKEIDDMFACTIVVDNLEAIKDAEDLIKKNYKVVTRKPFGRDTTHNIPENFSYDSLRLYCKMPTSRMRIFDDLLFEVQIKTFLEHAWAVATHDFQYKTDEVTWAKSRITSQLKAMLDNIDLTISQFSSLSKSSQLNKKHNEYIKINTTINFFKEHWTSNLLPEDLKRLAENTNKLMFALGIDHKQLKLILDAETEANKGTKTRSLSPFQIIVQSILSIAAHSVPPSVHPVCTTHVHP